MIVSAKGNPRHVFLDCGGHEGCSVRTFVKTRPGADRFEIYSFEPNARLAEYYAELPTTSSANMTWE